MKIIFCVPGRTFSNNFLISWTNLLKYCNENGIQAELSNGYTSIVHLARYACLGINPQSDCKECLNPFGQEIEYDYIMWIDSDMVFKPEDLQKLIDADKQVITGLAKIEASKYYACWVGEEDIRIDDTFLKKNSGVIEVSFTGMAFMLIKAGVYEAIPFPYFTVPGNWKCISETIGFCHNLKAHDIKIHANLDVIVGHEKPIIL